MVTVICVIIKVNYDLVKTFHMMKDVEKNKKQSPHLIPEIKLQWLSLKLFLRVIYKYIIPRDFIKAVCRIKGVLHKAK